MYDVFHRGCPAYSQQPCYFHRVWLHQEPAQIIYHQVCCHRQDEDEAWRSRFFHLWNYGVKQFTDWTSSHRLSSYISWTAEVTFL